MLKGAWRAPAETSCAAVLVFLFLLALYRFLTELVPLFLFIRCLASLLAAASPKIKTKENKRGAIGDPSGTWYISFHKFSEISITFENIFDTLRRMPVTRDDASN